MDSQQPQIPSQPAAPAKRDRPSAPTTIESHSPKSKLPFMAILVILLFLVAGSSYYFGTRNTQINQSFQLSPTQTLTVQPTTVIDETASWLTYTSDDLKITFKYPPNLQVESSKNEVKIFNSNTKNTPEYSFIEYVLYGNTTNQSIEDYVKKKENISSLKFSNLLVGGFEAKRTIEIPKSDINDSIFIKKGYEIYKFDLNNAGDAGSISSENFEKILSTFKFLD